MAALPGKRVYDVGALALGDHAKLAGAALGGAGRGQGLGAADELVVLLAQLVEASLLGTELVSRGEQVRDRPPVGEHDHEEDDHQGDPSRPVPVDPARTARTSRANPVAGD